MPVTRKVTLGAAFTSISATIPLHYLKCYLDGDRNSIDLQYKTPDDAFTATLSTDATSGDMIERKGPGRSGLLGVPTAYGRSGQVATVLLQVRCSDGSAKDLVVFESEDAL